MYMQKMITYSFGGHNFYLYIYLIEWLNESNNLVSHVSNA